MDIAVNPVNWESVSHYRRFFWLMGSLNGYLAAGLAHQKDSYI